MAERRFCGGEEPAEGESQPHVVAARRGRGPGMYDGWDGLAKAFSSSAEPKDVGLYRVSRARHDDVERCFGGFRGGTVAERVGSTESP